MKSLKIPLIIAASFLYLITPEPQPYLAVSAAWVESAQQYNQGGESCLQAYTDD